MTVPNKLPEGEHPESAGREARHSDTVELGASNEPQPWAGRELGGRYRILGLLGEGAMGALFLALHLELEKLVAIKVVPAELIGNGESVVRRTRAALGNVRFEHPHVVRANDCATLPEGGAYFVMQLVHGRGLSGMLVEGKPLPWPQSCAIGAQIADALAAAEAAGVVHRDLHPDNILLQEREDGGDCVMIIDFGVVQSLPAETISAEAAHNPRVTASWARTVIGTPGYMAPEQAIGASADHRSDLYALGVILWECIAGRSLWTGSDAASLLMRQVSEAAPPLRSVAPDSSRPPELDRLIERLLQRNPDERPAHAADVFDALRELSDEAALPRTNEDEAEGEGAANPAPSHAARRPSRWLGALALGCGAMLCFGAYRWSTTEDGRPSRAMARSDQFSATRTDEPQPPQEVAVGPDDTVASKVATTASALLGADVTPSHSEPQAVQEPPPARHETVAEPQARVSTREAREARGVRPPAARRAPARRPHTLRAGQAGGPAVVTVPLSLQPMPIEAPPPAAPKWRSNAEVSDLIVRGSVATSVVRRAIDRIHPRLIACRAGQAGVPSETEELEIEVAFDERGRVREPRTRGSSSPALHACVTAAAANISLSRVPDTGLAKASFRVKLSSAPAQ